MRRKEIYSMQLCNFVIFMVGQKSVKSGAKEAAKTKSSEKKEAVKAAASKAAKTAETAKHEAAKQAAAKKDASAVPQKDAKAESKPASSKATAAPQAPANADPWSVLLHPYLTEKSTRMVESQNKIVFMVKSRATKEQIKSAFEAAFGAKVASINTSYTMRGEKKALIRLKPEFKAVDIAAKLGMM